jgi:GNAT superfamily N-acetyltransferase
MAVRIEALAQIGFSTWEPMWTDYAGARGHALPSSLPFATYARLTEPSGRLRGLVALNDDGQALGFAHFFFHPSTWSLGDNCHLQDLYIAPAARGAGLARRLIEAVAEHARTHGCELLHWRTREANAAAHAAYRRLAEQLDFVSYQLAL